MRTISESTAIANCVNFIGKNVEPTLRRVLYFSADHLSRELGSPQDFGEYLIAFSDRTGQIRHFVVRDDTGEVSEMEEL